MPIGAYAPDRRRSTLHLTAIVISLDGSRDVRASVGGSIARAPTSSACASPTRFWLAVRRRFSPRSQRSAERYEGATMRRSRCLSDRHRPWRPRAHHRARARVPAHRRCRHPRPAGPDAAAEARAARRRADQRRQRGAAADGAGSDQPAGRREGARRQAGRAVEAGRSVRLRSRRRRGAVPARAWHSVRGRSGHPARHRRRRPTPACRSRIPAAATRSRWCADTRTRAARRPTSTGRAWRRLEGTIVCYAGAQQLPRMLDAMRANGWPGDDQAVVVYNGTLPEPGDRRRHDRGAARDACASIRDAAPAILVVGRVVGFRDHLRWFDARPLFGTPRAGDAASRSGGRAGRPADGARRRRDRSADDPHHAAARSRSAAARRGQRPSVRLDRLHQRQCRRSRS